MASDQREKWKQDIGRRISKARENADLGLEEIGRALGVSKQLVSHWCHGRSEISGLDIIRFARLSNVDAAWLLDGRGKSVAFESKQVSKADPTQLIDFAKMLADPDVVANRGGSVWLVTPQRVPVHSDVSSLALAFTVIDRAMAPQLDIGDLAIVDAGIDVEAGDVALFCLLETAEVLLRRYQPGDTGRSKGKHLATQFTLKATNSKFFPDRRVSREFRPVCLGTLVESVKICRKDARSAQPTRT